MTAINNSIYSVLNSYAGASDLASELTGNNSSDPSDTSSQTATEPSAVVTLSSAVTTARSREYLGLPPTGTITRTAIENAASLQKDIVNDTLADTIQSLGIDTDQEMTLRLDGKGSIVIEEDFKGKEDLETALNDNPKFIQAFAGLSTNTEVLDYAKALQTRSSNLANYLNQDSNDSDLLSLVAKYQNFRSSNTGIQALWNLSHNEVPFSFVYSFDDN